MRLLVVHQNFPGQFGHLVRAWSARPGWDVRGLGRDSAPGLPGFDRLLRYPLARSVRADQHLYLRQTEASTLHGQAAARAMLALRRTGFVPDVILAHPGWGETLFAKDVFPDAKLVHLCEWYYNADGADLGFDPEFPLRFDDRARVRIWNAQHALDLIQCDLGISPTWWQRSRYPALLQHKITVQHEGIDVDGLAPDAGAALCLPDGSTFRAGDPVITYVARNLEPYRGFHVFMRALARIQAHDARCHAVIVGGDDVSYGSRPEGAACWRDKLLAEVPLDPARTHFLGRVPRALYVRVLQVSAVHVYLTYPFVLSWSLLEAMACGCAIVASDTAPVREVLRDGVHGRLVDGRDPLAVANAVHAELIGTGDPARRVLARREVRRFDRAQALLGYDRLIDGVLAPRAPLPGTAETGVHRACPTAPVDALATAGDRG